MIFTNKKKHFLLLSGNRAGEKIYGGRGEISKASTLPHPIYQTPPKMGFVAY